MDRCPHGHPVRPYTGRGTKGQVDAVFAAGDRHIRRRKRVALALLGHLDGPGGTRLLRIAENRKRTTNRGSDGTDAPGHVVGDEGGGQSAG